MFVRSPLHAWISNPELLLPLASPRTARRWATSSRRWSRWASATPSARVALKQPLVGRRWAWAGFWLVAVGAVTAMVPVALGLRLGALHLLPAADRQPVLLHRRRPGGRRLLDLGRADVDQPRASGSGTIPASPCRWRCSPTSPAPTCGPGRRSAPRSSSCCRSCRSRSAFKSTIDAGLARVFFSWTLHAIVYFWLMPTYIAYYTIVPRAIGGTALQRHDGQDRLHPVPGRGDADRRCTTSSPTRRSAPASSSCTRCSRRWWRCRRC